MIRQYRHSCAVARAAGLLACLALSAQAAAEVLCTNENTAVPEATPTADYVIHGDGTVTHKRTGLMWMQCSLGQTLSGGACTGAVGGYPWQDALNAVVTLNSSGGLAGYTDWRLPNKNELESIVEDRCWSPSINLAVFPDTPVNLYWTSSPYPLDVYASYVVVFSLGGVNYEIKDQPGNIRLVRAGH